MLIRSVVHHQIHEELHAPLVDLVTHGLPVLQRAEAGVDIPVIGDVVAVVRLGRNEIGAGPNGVHAQALDVIQFGGDPCQIPFAVSVTVEKTAGIDLVEYGILPPVAVFVTHYLTPFLQHGGSAL